MKTYCRLTRHHLFRCQLRKCGLEPEKIDWFDLEQRARARECIKKLYTPREWTLKGKHKYVIFYLTELSRRRYRENRERFRQIRKARCSKKLSWEQIWEIIHRQHDKKEVGRVGIGTFIANLAYRYKRYRLNRQMILSMTKEDLKRHITDVILEKRLGENWKDVLYSVWEKVSYSGTPAEYLITELEITIPDILGKTFEEFVKMVREKLWLRDKGMLTRKAKFRKGIKEKLRRARPKIDNPKELAKILERTNVRHAMLMASERLYGNILRWFKKGVNQIIKEELMAYLTSREEPMTYLTSRRPRRPKVERQVDSEEELLKLLDVEDVQVVLGRASLRLYNGIKEYYRLRGLSVKDLTKEHVAYYLHLRTAKRDVENLEELLKLIDQWGVKYALRRMSRRLYKNVWSYFKYHRISLDDITAEDLKYYLCQRARAI